MGTFGGITRHPNGTFQVRMQVSENGKTARKSFGYYKTRREAARVLAEATTHYVGRTGHKVDSRYVPDYETLSTRWLDKAIAPGRPGTYRLYARLLRDYLWPVIGGKRADTLTPADVDEIQHHAKARLGARSIDLVLTVGHSSLAWADKKEKIAGITNVFHKATRLYRAKPRQYAVVSGGEGARLLAALSQSRYQHAFTLMLLLGLRVNEALGLRWRDMDLDHRGTEGHGRLTVAGQLAVVDGNRHRSNETKTESSHRIITPLPEPVITALKAQRKTQMAEQAAADGVWLNNDDLVFTAGFGLPAGERSVRRDFHRYIAAAVRAGDLPAVLGCGQPVAAMRLHDLRHSCATILLAMAIPLPVVSAILGHKDSSITLRVYSHVLPQMQTAAADAMTRAFAVE